MGYSYDQFRRLSCDRCGRVGGGVKKRRCPWGYCPPPALCNDCRDADAQSLSREHHRELGCEDNHNRFVAREREAQRL